MNPARILSLLTLAVAGTAPAWAGPNLLTNGGFEAPVSAFPYANYATGATLPGWTIVEVDPTYNTSHGWDHFVSVVPSATFAGVGVTTPYGAQFADLTGVFGQGKGVRSVDVATEIGATYRLSFALGEFWVGGQGSYGEASVNLKINGADQGLFRNLVTLAGPGSDWRTQSLDFVATQANTHFQFTNAIGAAYSNAGTGLDDVKLEYLSAPLPAVPEPETYALMLAGLAIVGGVSRRRR